MAATLLAFASCSKDDDGPSGKIDLKVQAVAPTTEDKVPDYSQFTVTVSSERDGKTMTESLDASGSATFNLDIGSYGIEIRGKENGKEYFGTTGMAQYGQSTTVSVAWRTSRYTIRAIWTASFFPSCSITAAPTAAR